MVWGCASASVARRLPLSVSARDPFLHSALPSSLPTARPPSLSLLSSPPPRPQTPTPPAPHPPSLSRECMPERPPLCARAPGVLARDRLGATLLRRDRSAPAVTLSSARVRARALARGERFASDPPARWWPGGPVFFSFYVLLDVLARVRARAGARVCVCRRLLAMRVPTVFSRHSRRIMPVFTAAGPWRRGVGAGARSSGGGPTAASAADQPWTGAFAPAPRSLPPAPRLADRRRLQPPNRQLPPTTTTTTRSNQHRFPGPPSLPVSRHLCAQPKAGCHGPGDRDGPDSDRLTSAGREAAGRTQGRRSSRRAPRAPRLFRDPRLPRTKRRAGHNAVAFGLASGNAATLWLFDSPSDVPNRQPAGGPHTQQHQRPAAPLCRGPGPGRMLVCVSASG